VRKENTRDLWSFFGQSFTTVTFTWNSSGFAKGNYTISAYAWPVQGETDVADNSLDDVYVFVTLPGDINGDKKVNILDAIVLASYFNQEWA
jgi:hypothetical protein